VVVRNVAGRHQHLGRGMGRLLLRDRGAHGRRRRRELGQPAGGAV
jgi:hypothetical protein